MAGGSFHKGVFGMKQQRVACRLPGCKEEKLLFCGGSTPVCCILAVNFLLRGRALLHIRLYCFSIDLQGRNYGYRTLAPPRTLAPFLGG